MEFFDFGLGQTILAVFLGIGLAASAGFRVFLPLFAMSLGTHFDIIPLAENWQWVGDSTALFTLGAASIFEIFAYYIPWLDNLLDTAAIPLATIAGTLMVGAQLADLDMPILTWALAIIAGGGTAATIKSAAAGGRATSTATTGGTGNFAIATAETGSSIVLIITSLIAPILAFILSIVVLIGVYKLYKLLKRNFWGKKKSEVVV